MPVLNLEILFKFRIGRAIVVGDIANDITMFKQCDARTYIYRMLKIMTGYQYCSTIIAVIVFQKFLQNVLRRRVEEVERLIENHKFRTVQQC